MNPDAIAEILDAKMETVHAKLDAIKEQTTKTNGRVADHEERVRKLEAFHYKSAGWMAAAVIIIEFVFNFLA